MDDTDHVVGNAAVLQRRDHAVQLAALLLLVVQRVQHRQADGVLLGGLRLSPSHSAHVGVLDDAHQLLQLVAVVAAARQRLLQRADRRQSVLLHDAAQLRRQRDVALRRQLQQLVVLELLHERAHVRLYASRRPHTTTQQLLLALVRRGEGVRLLLDGRVQVAEVVPLVLLQELVRLRVQHELVLVVHLHAVVPDRHELVHHAQVQPLHQQRRHRVALAVHDHQLAVAAVVEQAPALVLALDLVQHLARQAARRLRRGLVADVRTLLQRQAGRQDALVVREIQDENVGGAMEHVVLGNLPLVGIAAQLHAVDQVQRVVVRVDGDEVAVVLVHLLHAVALIGIGELLDVVRSANVREVYRRAKEQRVQMWYSPYLGFFNSAQSSFTFSSLGRTNTMA